MHRCSVTAVGTDDFPTFIPSCYSYCQCRKLYYSIGDGFFERVEKFGFFFLPMLPCAALNMNPSGILSVLVCNLKSFFQFHLVPSYHISRSSYFPFFSVLPGCFSLSFFPPALRRQVVVLTDKNDSQLWISLLA